MPTPAMLLGMEAEKVQVRSTKNIYTALWLVTGSGSMSQKMLSPEAIISKLLCVSFTTGKCLRPGLEQRKMSYRHKSLDCVSGLLSAHNTFLLLAQTPSGATMKHLMCPLNISGHAIRFFLHLVYSIKCIYIFTSIEFNKI